MERLILIEETVDHLGKLVAIRSVPGACNLEITSYCEDALVRAGARVRRIRSPLGDADGLLASLGPDEAGGIVLSGHLDVVPVEGQDWSGDPFALRPCAGRLLGRGTTDMKGFVACALALAGQVEGPLHIALSADEETTCRSVEPLACAVAALPTPRGVIVGEPTEMRVLRAHPGSATYLVRASGRSVHAARRADGVSAIALAAEVVSWTRRRATPYGAGWVATQISGGEIANSVPGACTLTLDLRLPSDTDVAAAEDALRRALHRIEGAAGDGACLTAERTAWFPPFSEPRSGFAQACAAASNRPEAPMMGIGTEAGHYREVGLPTVVMGPGRLEDAHRPDEGIDLAELRRCLTVLQLLA